MAEVRAFTRRRFCSKLTYSTGDVPKSRVDNRRVRASIIVGMRPLTVAQSQGRLSLLLPTPNQPGRTSHHATSELFPEPSMVPQGMLHPLEMTAGH